MLSTGKNGLLVSMSKASRKFKVPDELAHLYDFANTIDLRHFTHHGIQHPQGDELANSSDLAGWMAERKLLPPGGKITAPMLAEALELRAALRAYLQRDPEKRSDKETLRALNRAMGKFPLLAEAGADGAMILRGARKDALSGLSVVVGELLRGSDNGTLDRLKMCASDECRRVFYDRSKPGTRRWCVSTLCGNREKTRAYRARQQG
ncbi:CGNR zinc finger domain-containing protein [Afipia sp. TerB]